MRETYVFRGGKLVRKNAAARRKGGEVIPDIAPYRSMITGEIISSRTAHRDHLRRHNCVEVGNEKLF